MTGLASYVYKNYYLVEWETVETVEDMDRALSTSKRTWLVYTLPTYIQDKYPNIIQSIQDNFIIAREFPGTLNGGTIYVCVSKEVPDGNFKG